MLFDGGRGHLNPTVAGLATFQGLDFIAVECKTAQVSKLRRIGEYYKRQKAGNLAKAVEIAGQLEVGFGSGMDEDRTKQQDLGRHAGRKSLRDRMSISDGGDLILSQSNVLPKESLKVRIRPRKAGQCGHSHHRQQSGSRYDFSDHGNFTSPIRCLALGTPIRTVVRRPLRHLHA